jgi:uncharacterized protein (DUF1800 family)
MNTQPPPQTLPPREAWQPLPPQEWNAEHARHLFRRASWAALPEQVDESLKLGPEATVRRLFANRPVLPLPRLLAEVEEEQRSLYRRTREAATPQERQEMQREARQRAMAAFHDMTVRWLDHAADPRHAAYEKWVTFLQNIFVVSFDRVRNPAFIFRHHDLLRTHATGSYRDLCRSVSRSPAMIRYLDLQVSKASAPNENFARELFELFMLGEGNYTESDIKEAARAFTGYRERQGEFFLARAEQDRGSKTVFGRTGNWTGDDVIRLALDEKAAATFLPAQMCRFYLRDEALPPPYLEELGRIWREADFDLGVLVQRFFSSRLFYDPRFRGQLIKSPLHFHLGLVQDLQVTVPPYPRQIVAAYRQMGQQLFHPPNVRGWVGGQLWINASTIAARRQLVENLFQPVDESRLNADDQAALRAAREDGRRIVLSVSRERLGQMAEAEPAVVADRFLQYFLPRHPGSDYRTSLIAHLSGGPGNRVERIRTAAMAMLQSPEYHLC